MSGYPPLLDHLVWLAANLDEACAQFEAMSGVAAQHGGKHPIGTHNALVGLGPQVYLEIVAPQPGVTEGHPWVTAARNRPEPHLLAYCMRSAQQLPDLAKQVTTMGLSDAAPFPLSRAQPNGKLLEWELYMPSIPGAGAAVPFLIDWAKTPHPSISASSAATLMSFAVEHPDPDSIAPAMSLLAPGVRVTRGSDDIRLRAEIGTPKGVVMLEG